MKQNRKWQIETGSAVNQEADRLGLTNESWEIVKLIPSAAIDDYEKIEVAGSVICHQCGKPLAFEKCFTWGMLAPSRLFCPDCNVDISIGAYDQASANKQPLWIYASPFTESDTPEHRNSILIQTIDGYSTVSGDIASQTGNRPKAKQLSDQGVACVMRNDIKGAREKWIAATQEDPTWAIPYFNIAKSYIDAKVFQDAESYLNQAEERARSYESSEDSQVLEQVNTIRARIVLQRELQKRKTAEAGALDKTERSMGGATSMTITVEADSLKAARDSARAKTPRRQHTLGEKILRKPTSDAVEGKGATEADAREHARALLPRDAIRTGETVIAKAGLQTLTFRGLNEAIAKENAKAYGEIESIRISKPARRGILGFGRRLLNEYAISLNCQARIRLTYKTTAALDVQIGTLPPTAHCQVCGQEGYVHHVGSDTAFYACAPCTETYCAAIQRLADALLGPLAALDRSGSFEERQFMKRIDAENQARLNKVTTLRAFRCWKCGSAAPLALEAICPSCGMYQNALLQSGTAKQ